jgi:hypothetical protein
VAADERGGLELEGSVSGRIELHGRAQVEIAYHWSPSSRRKSIEQVGLCVGSNPVVNGIQGDHRNPYISLSPTPAQAWWLSGGALAIGGFNSESDVWDLYEVDIKGRVAVCRDDDYPEIKVYEDIPADHVIRVAQRAFAVHPGVTT